MKMRNFAKQNKRDMHQQQVSQKRQFVISVEDRHMVPHLKKVLGQIHGVTIESIHKPRAHKSGLDQAISDVKEGNVTHWDCSTGDMLRTILQG